MIMNKKVYLTAEVFGMCGGVHAALKTLDGLLDSAGRPVFVFHELVHNRRVTESYRARGVVFAENIEDIPLGATLVIGAHGVAPDVEKLLRSRAGICLDATCPLVKKLHHIAGALTGEDELIIFGKKGHPEVAGVAGYSGTDKVFLISSPEEAIRLPQLNAPVFISQTTVDHKEVERTLDILQTRFPSLRPASDICDASSKRQLAVEHLAGKVEAVVVIGSDHSSNARRLCEIAGRTNCPGFLIESAAEFPPELLKLSKIGITGGASTPQTLFDEVIAFLERNGFQKG